MGESGADSEAGGRVTAISAQCSNNSSNLTGESTATKSNVDTSATAAGAGPSKASYANSLELESVAASKSNYSETVGLENEQNLVS